MKKLFTFFAAILVAGSMWGEDVTLYSMENPTAPTTNLDSRTGSALTATYTNGTGYVYNGKSSAAPLVTNGQVNLGGSGNSYFKLTILCGAIQVDDIIDVADGVNSLDKSSESKSALYISTSTTKGSKQYNFPHTVTEEDGLAGRSELYLWKSGSSTFTVVTISRSETKVIVTQNYYGFKKDGEELNNPTDYTWTNGTPNVVTLNDTYKSTTAPEGYTWKNHITYADESVEDKDVAVEFTRNGDYWEATMVFDKENPSEPGETISVMIRVPYDYPTIGLPASYVVPEGTLSLTFEGMASALKSAVTNGTPYVNESAKTFNIGARNAYASANTNKIDWVAMPKNGTNNGGASTNADWNATGDFVGNVALGDDKCATSRIGDRAYTCYAYRVTAANKISALVKSATANDPVTLSAFELTDGEPATSTILFAQDKSRNVATLSVNLDENKEYLILLYATGTSNASLYELAFGYNNAVAAPNKVSTIYFRRPTTGTSTTTWWYTSTPADLTQAYIVDNAGHVVADNAELANNGDGWYSLKFAYNTSYTAYVKFFAYPEWNGNGSPYSDQNEVYATGQYEDVYFYDIYCKYEEPFQTNGKNGIAWTVGHVYERSMTVDDFGTICLPKKIDFVENATMYSIVGKGGNLSYIKLGEEDTFVAGKPYIFKATAANVKFIHNIDGNATVQEANGLVGNLGEAAVIAQDGDNYVISGADLYLVNSEVTVGQFRAYVDASAIEEVAAAPERTIILGSNPVATGMENAALDVKATKALMDGKLVILRGNRMFNLNGMLVK